MPRHDARCYKATARAGKDYNLVMIVELLGTLQLVGETHPIYLQQAIALRIAIRSVHINCTEKKKRQTVLVHLVEGTRIARFALC